MSKDILNLNRSLSHKSQSNQASSNSSFSSCSACSGEVGSGSFCCSSACIPAESAEVAVDAIAAPLLSAGAVASPGVWRACSSQLDPSEDVVSENVECMPPESASVGPQTPTKKKSKNHLPNLPVPGFSDGSSSASVPRSAFASSAASVNLESHESTKIRISYPSRFWSCKVKYPPAVSRLLENTPNVSKCLEFDDFFIFSHVWTPTYWWFPSHVGPTLPTWLSLSMLAESFGVDPNEPGGSAMPQNAWHW